jgi:hypothetical protein
VYHWGWTRILLGCHKRDHPSRLTIWATTATRVAVVQPV